MPKRASLRRLLLRPAGLLGREFDDVGEAAAVEREFVGVPFVHLTPLLVGSGPSNVEHVLHAIAVGRGASSSRNECDGERVVDVRHRAQPADADVVRRRSVLGAVFGMRYGRFDQAHAHLERGAVLVARESNVEAMGGKTLRCSQAVGLPLASTAAFMYMAGDVW